MGRQLRNLVAIVATVVLASCAGAPSSSEFSKQDADEIRGMVRDFVAAYNAKDVDKIMTFYAGTASLMPINRNTVRGTEAVRGYYESRVKDEGGTDLAIEPIAVDGQGTLGYVAANFSMAFRPPDGSPERRDRGRVIWVARKYAGHWKFEWQIMSSDLPPAAAAGK